MFTPAVIEAIHAEARSSFHPRDTRHEYIQWLSVCLTYRTGYPPREGSVGRRVLKMALLKARELRGLAIESELSTI